MITPITQHWNKISVEMYPDVATFQRYFIVSLYHANQKYSVKYTISDQLLVELPHGDIAAHLTNEVFFKFIDALGPLPEQIKDDVFYRILELLTTGNYPLDMDSASGTSIAKQVDVLPGIDCVVKYPCNCPGSFGRRPTSDTLKMVIIHLNDHHKWSREKIADWMDKLHDNGKINIEF